MSVNGRATYTQKKLDDSIKKQKTRIVVAAKQRQTLIKKGIKVLAVIIDEKGINGT